jgi:hypothetical protein
MVTCWALGLSMSPHGSQLLQQPARALRVDMPAFLPWQAKHPAIITSATFNISSSSASQYVPPGAWTCPARSCQVQWTCPRWSAEQHCLCWWASLARRCSSVASVNKGYEHGRQPLQGRYNGPTPWLQLERPACWPPLLQRWVAAAAGQHRAGQGW